MSSHRAIVRSALAMMVTLALSAASASAAGFGPRFGLTLGPDQVHAGFQFHAAQLARHASFVPSFDVGAGDDAITVAANMDFKYVFVQRTAHWHPYLGGGPGLFFVDVDRQSSQTDVGMNFFAGLQTPTRSGLFFGEMRLGLVDAPDAKFTIGWMFH